MFVVPTQALMQSLKKTLFIPVFIPPSLFIGGILLALDIPLKAAALVSILLYYFAICGHVLAAKLPMCENCSDKGLWSISLLLGVVAAVISQQCFQATPINVVGWVLPGLVLIFCKTESVTIRKPNIKSDPKLTLAFLICTFGLIADVYVMFWLCFIFSLILFFIKQRYKRIGVWLIIFLNLIYLKISSIGIIFRSLIQSDDSIYLEAYGYSIHRHGFWSWSTSSETWNVYHWFTYGVSGLFSDLANLPSMTGPTIFLTILSATVISGCLSTFALFQTRSVNTTSYFLITFPLFGKFLYGSVSPSLDMGIIVAFVLILVIFGIFERNSINKSSFLILSILTFILGTTKFHIFLVTIPSIFALIAPKYKIIRFRKIAFYSCLAIATGTLSVLVFTIDILKIGSNADFGISKMSLKPWFYQLIHLQLDKIDFANLQRLLLTVLFAAGPQIITTSLYINRDDFFIRFSRALTLFSVILYLILGIEHTEYMLFYAFWFSIVAITPHAIDKLILYTGELRKNLLLLMIAMSAFFSICIYVLRIRSFNGDYWMRINTDSIYFQSPVFFSAIFGLLALNTISYKYRADSTFAIKQVFLIAMLAGSLIATDCNLLLGDWILRDSNAQRNQLITKSITDTDLIAASEWIRDNTDYDVIVVTNYQCFYLTACDLDGVTPISALSQRRTYFEAARFAIGATDSPLRFGDHKSGFPDWVLGRWKLSTSALNRPSTLQTNTLIEAGVSWALVDLRVTDSNNFDLVGVERYKNKKFAVVQLNQN